MPNDFGLPEPLLDGWTNPATGQVVGGVTRAGVVFSSGLQVSGPISTPENSAAPRMGTVALNGTTAVTVTTTGVTANSRVFLTIQAPAGTPGAPYVASITPGTGFTVKSAAGDTSTVAWFLVDRT